MSSGISRSGDEAAAHFQVDAEGAVRFVSASMMLSWILLAAFSIAIALTLSGRTIGGCLMFVVAVGFRWLVKRSAPGYVVRRALQDPSFFEAALAARAIRMVGKP